MPAVDMFSADRGPHTNAVAETDTGAVTVPNPRTDARTDDGDARADASSLRKSDARALVATDNRSALIEADASALLVGSLLERQEYG